MGSPRRFARGSLENHFAGASSTLGSLGSEAHSISRYQAHAGFQGEDKAAISKLHSEAGVSATRSGVGCSAQGEARRRAHHFGRGRRDVPLHPRCVAESAHPGSRAACHRTHQVHEVVSGEEAETCRGGTPSHSKGQGSSGRDSHRTGEGGSIVGRRGAEVGRVDFGRESLSISFCRAATSRAGGFFRVESEAGHHRQPSTRVGQVAFSRSCEPHCGRRRIDGGGSPHKKSRVCPATPMAIAGIGAPRTPLAIMGGHAQGSNDGLHLC